MWLKEDGRKDIELMNDEIITQILRKMLPYLENEQMKILQEILQHSFYGLQISRVEGYIKQEENVENSELLQKFIASKRVEGCSEKRYITMRALSLKCLHCWISMCIKYGLMI